MPSKELTVSVVMCTHNGMEFIEEQLRSILNQSYTPYELIVSDDNSTDGTLKFVVDYVNNFISKQTEQQKLKFEAFQNVPALGVAKNFENAISVATGDLIALCDQDDVWFPDKLLTQVKRFQSEPQLVLLHSDANLVDATNKSLGITLFQSLRLTNSEKKNVRRGNAKKVLIRRNIVTGATTMFRSQIIPLASIFPESWLHDEWLAIVASFNGLVEFDEKCLINYRQHSKNQIGAKKIGIRQYLGRIFFPGRERNQHLLLRASEANNHQFFQQLTKESDRYLIEGKLQHELFRNKLSSKRLLRIIPITREYLQGNYNLYGIGYQDVIRDLLQPL